MKATYRVYEPRLEGLREQLVKLNRKCAKLGIAPIVLTAGAVEEVPVRRRDLPNQIIGGFDPNEIVSYKRFVSVEVSGESPKFAGWNLAAIVEHAAEGNILRKSPDCAVELSQFRATTPHCDHCHLERNRRETYVVIHDNGDQKQIGSNCLKDFLGHANPHDLAKYAELCYSLNELCGEAENDGDSEGSGSSRNELLSVLTFLAYSACAIRHFGFVSSKRAKEDLTGNSESSASTANFWLNPPRNAKREELKQPEAVDLERAQVSRDYVLATLGSREASSLSDFEHNLLTLCKCEAVERRNCGLIAFVPEYYARETERSVKRARAVADSKHFEAEVGKRVRNVQVTYARSTGFDSQFGYTFIHIFTAESGATLVWKTSAGINDNPGTNYSATFTVKEHGDYNGAKQTKISRAVLSALPVAELCANSSGAPAPAQ